MSVKRIEVLRKIDTLLDVCEECDKRPIKTQQKIHAEMSRHCRKVCPVGLELKGLGNHLAADLGKP